MRGNKIWISAMLLSLVLSMLAFVGPVPAQASALISVPTIDNPFMAPGGTFTMDILVNNVVQMWGFELMLLYNKDVLTATSMIANPVDPVASTGFKVITAATIDDSTGTIHFAANRGPSGRIMGEVIGIGNGATKTFFVDNPRVADWNGDGVLNRNDVVLYYNGVAQPATTVRDVTATGRVRIATAQPAPAPGVVVSLDYYHPGLTVDANFPVGSITFSIDSRGVSALDLDSTSLTDIYMNAIAHDPIDGSFDNRFHGHLAAPLMMDEALVPGSEFDVVVTADNVRTPTWGVSFFLDYDTNVLTALTGVVDDMAGTTYVQVTGLSLVTVAPVALATVHFRVDAEGWSLLDIRDVAAVSIYGDLLVFDHTDGSFASTQVVDLTGRAAWPEKYSFKQSDEPDMIDTLFAEVSTSGTGAPIAVRVRFSIFDEEAGTLLGTINSETVIMTELVSLTLTGSFDTTAWGMPKYHVWLGAQVEYDSNGDGMMDSLGSRIKPISIVVKP